MPLKIIFAGTPDFAVPALKALIDSDHSVVAVYTQPDKPKGRGQKLQAPPVKVLAQENDLQVFQPKTLRDSQAQVILSSHDADLMVVVAYGLILPQAVLDMPRFGCINIHPSLLPKWRGAAPIQRSLEAGEKETGVTIMQMDAGMDTGPILLQEKIYLNGTENSLQAHNLFSELGARHLLKVIKSIEEGCVTPQAQDNTQATYANKITKEEKVIDWSRPAEAILHQVQAFNPWPVATTHFENEPLKVFEVVAIDQAVTLPPGTLIQVNEDCFDVATGQGMLRVFCVQQPGKKRMAARDFLHGKRNSLVVGETVFG